jgi:adenylate kinase
MRKIVVVLYGPPGAGKGTQANLLATKLGSIHFDTGKFCESVVHDPGRQKEKVIQRERKLFESGKWMTPSFVTREVVKQIKQVAAANMGIIFSGSPRTIYEAEREFPALEKAYGKKNIFVFSLEIPAEFSLRRNGGRMVCPVCGYFLLVAFYPKVKAKWCPVCGSPLYRRSLDTPETTKRRLREHNERTLPVLDFAKKRGYKIFHIDGHPAPYKVMGRIYAHIKNV